LVPCPIASRIIRITVPIAVVAIGVAASQKEERHEQEKITHSLLLERRLER
jgi:hypothetical protein